MSTVLLIEDDPDLRALMCEALTASGATVHTAADGPSGLALLEHGLVPDVVFSDLILPGVLGSSVVEYLHAHPALEHTKIAIVTGSPELAPDHVPVFVKPVPLEKLVEFMCA